MYDCEEILEYFHRLGAAERGVIGQAIIWREEMKGTAPDHQALVKEVDRLQRLLDTPHFAQEPVLKAIQRMDRSIRSMRDELVLPEEEV